MLHQHLPFTVILGFLSLPALAQEPDIPIDKAKFAERTAVRAAELLRSKKTTDEMAAGLVRMVMFRQPTENELKIATEFLGKKDREEAARDIIWACVNTKEFMRNLKITDPKEADEIFQQIEKAWPKK